MSPTRKILLALSILIGLLGLFRVYDMTASDYAEENERSRARDRAELRALEAGEPPPNGVPLDEYARKTRIDNLRSWTSGHEAEAARERDERIAGWRDTILTLLLAGGLAGTAFVMGRKNGPPVVARLSQVRPGVVVAALAGLISGYVLITFTQGAFEAQQDVAHAEQRLEETKRKLQSFEYDANGNIAPEETSSFNLTLSEAKYAPQHVVSARENLTTCLMLVAGSALVLGLSIFFGRRSWKRSFAAPPPAQPTTAPVAA